MAFCSRLSDVMTRMGRFYQLMCSTTSHSGSISQEYLISVMDCSYSGSVKICQKTTKGRKSWKQLCKISPIALELSNKQRRKTKEALNASLVLSLSLSLSYSSRRGSWCYSELCLLNNRWDCRIPPLVTQLFTRPLDKGPIPFGKNITLQIADNFLIQWARLWSLSRFFRR